MLLPKAKKSFAYTKDIVGMTNDGKTYTNLMEREIWTTSPENQQC
jgi:hypothetical protein